MKKIVMAAALLFLGATATKAQGFRIGAKAGANLTKLDGVSFSNEYKLGYQFGGFIELDFNKHVGIQPEVLFSQTNTKVASGFSSIYNNLGIASPEGEGIKLNYLSIPVLLRVNVSKMLTLQAGPQFSILMNDNQNLFQNGREAFKNGDVSMLAGAQLNISAFRLYGRYNFGVSNINNVDGKDKWRNQQWQLGVGFRIL
ncbi:MAG TPA: hypothetical protein DCL43_06240 [Chitinophagaceae bacterium]|nr:hypothetical protein [Chitinophagaceae bacterium]HAN39040.1 hypothetical protein [Chitinophagaceae bacterium]